MSKSINEVLTTLATSFETEEERNVFFYNLGKAIGNEGNFEQLTNWGIMVLGANFAIEMRGVVNGGVRNVNNQEELDELDFNNKLAAINE